MTRLACPVRNCGLALQRAGQQLRCANNHSFDLARSGYANLLQPQDRKAKQPGDSAQAVAARRRLHDRGLTEPLLNALIQPAASDIVLDVGCGEGFYLGSLQQRHGFEAHGVDLSTSAIDLAARRYPACQWIVANADRQIPYLDASFSLILSITARMNPEEFSRVLQPAGKLLVAIPAPQDLIELRGIGKERLGRTIESFASHFKPAGTSRVTHTAALDPESLEDLRLAIYRPTNPATPSSVTFSLDLIVFEKLS